MKASGLFHNRIFYRCNRRINHRYCCCFRAVRHVKSGTRLHHRSLKETSRHPRFDTSIIHAQHSHLSSDNLTFGDFQSLKYEHPVGFWTFVMHENDIRSNTWHFQCVLECSLIRRISLWLKCFDVSFCLNDLLKRRRCDLLGISQRGKNTCHENSYETNSKSLHGTTIAP